MFKGFKALSLLLTIANIKFGTELFLMETRAEPADEAKSVYAKHLVWAGVKANSISFQGTELKGAKLKSSSLLGSFGVILKEDMILTLAYGKSVKGAALLLILLKQIYPNSKITIEDYVGYGLTKYEKNLSDENSAGIKIKSKEGKIFLIQLENKIKINSNAAAKILLPKRKYQDGAKCVVVGPGYISPCEGISSDLFPGVLPGGIPSQNFPDICRVVVQDFSPNLHANANNPKDIQDFPVEILNWSTCKENLSDLDNDLICLTKSECTEFNGGEPLICGDVLTGLIYKSNTTCYGVNIYHYGHWIQSKILEAERNEGQGRIRKPRGIILFVLCLWLSLWLYKHQKGAYIT